MMNFNNKTTLTFTPRLVQHKLPTNANSSAIIYRKHGPVAALAVDQTTLAPGGTHLETEQASRYIAACATTSNHLCFQPSKKQVAYVRKARKARACHMTQHQHLSTAQDCIMLQSAQNLTIMRSFPRR